MAYEQNPLNFIQKQRMEKQRTTAAVREKETLQLLLLERNIRVNSTNPRKAAREQEIGRKKTRGWVGKRGRGGRLIEMVWVNRRGRRVATWRRENWGRPKQAEEGSWRSGERERERERDTGGRVGGQEARVATKWIDRLRHGVGNGRMSFKANSWQITEASSFQYYFSWSGQRRTHG